MATVFYDMDANLEGCRSQPALVGHFVEGPFLRDVQEKRTEKQFHGAARGNEASIQFEVARLEKFAQGDERLVDV